MTDMPASDKAASDTSSPGEPASGHDHDHGHEATPCESALQELYLFLDGELTVDKRSQIKTHLDDCSPCFEAFDFEAELRNVISKRCRDEVPDSLREAVARILDNPTDTPADH
jgi:mycothiol system anti-sigma-R factor